MAAVSQPSLPPRIFLQNSVSFRKIGSEVFPCPLAASVFSWCMSANLHISSRPPSTALHRRCPTNYAHANQPHNDRGTNRPTNQPTSDCLRGELRSLRTNVDTLCGQMRALQPSPLSTATAATTTPTTTETATPSPPAPSEKGELTLAADEGDMNDDELSAVETFSSGVLPREHLKLEVQVQSQFQLLWAVFRSHSTAEDEVIWPALKEKARSSGGKVSQCFGISWDFECQP